MASFGRRLRIVKSPNKYICFKKTLKRDAVKREIKEQFVYTDVFEVIDQSFT